MVRSRICEMLGIRYPVFQGGIVKKIEPAAAIVEGQIHGAEKVIKAVSSKIISYFNLIHI